MTLLERDIDPLLLLDEPRATNAARTHRMTSSWEDLRKEARHLENQIDVKLVAYSKLGSGIHHNSHSDKAPLLGANSASETFAAASAEMEGLLARLAQVNDGMTNYAASQPQSGAIHHTLQRHRDILQDYRQEFTKTRSNISAMLEREDLLSSVHRDISDFRRGAGGHGGNARMDMLLKESESARNSERLIDEQIEVALETRETLMNQRIAFKAIQTKLNDISNRFPLINSLIQKVNVRKRRDSIILGLVIGLCLIFMIWYAFG